MGELPDHRKDTNLHGVTHWFGVNLKIASFLINTNTSIQSKYKFIGHNVLANNGPVRENHIHMDFEPQPGRPKLRIPNTFISTISGEIITVNNTSSF